ncbi:MAG TPA: hypothetical protein DDW26_11000 [Rhizobiales bacterium]|jgi:hypothetical protein|nr:hypothetical protein [Hyphomicrobiales bacterium]
MTLVFRCFGAPAYCELHAKGESTEQDGPPDEGGDREEDIDSKGRAEGSGLSDSEGTPPSGDDPSSSSACSENR